jgi:molybdate transport system substrate-binding protein
MGLVFLVKSALLTTPGTSGCAKAAEKETLSVFAPASLSDILPQLAESWTKKSGVPVVFQFGASSQMARQISEGAVVDVMISAHESWTRELLTKGDLLPPTVRRLFANRLVIAGSRTSPTGATSQGTPSSTSSSVTDEKSLRALLEKAPQIALAGEQVPAGVYGEEALKSLKVWDLVSSKLVRGDHVRTVTRWLSSGAAPVGVIYRTDALASDLPILYKFDGDTHTPIVYIGAVVKRGGHPKFGAFFLDFLTSGGSQEIYQKAGFLIPQSPKKNASRP